MTDWNEQARVLRIQLHGCTELGQATEMLATALAAVDAAAYERGRVEERDAEEKRRETGRMISRQTHKLMLKELAKANAENQP